MRNRRSYCSNCFNSKYYPIKYCQQNLGNMEFQLGDPTNLFSTFNPMSSGADPVSYATFWNNRSMKVEVGNNFEFNQAGIGTPDIVLVNPGIIKIYNSGVYHITYRINISIQGVPSSTEVISNRASLYINLMQQPSGESGFSIQTPDVTSCIPLNGDALIFIPANSCLSLVNESESVIGNTITTCASSGNAVTLSIFRVN